MIFISESGNGVKIMSENNILQPADALPAGAQTYQPNTAELLMASSKFLVLKQEIEAFQANLSDDVDVVLALASFGNDTLMQVAKIGFRDPDILYFWGYINGNEAELIQHVTQLNFILMTAQKADPSEPPRRIGFNVEDEIAIEQNA